MKPENTIQNLYSIPESNTSLTKANLLETIGDMSNQVLAVLGITRLVYSTVTFPSMSKIGVSYNQSTTETDLFSASIPGGTLSSTRLIKGRVYITNYQSNDALQTLTVRLKYGSTTVASIVLDPVVAVTASSRVGYFDFILAADGTTSAQYGVLHTVLTNTGVDTGASISGLMNIATGTSAEASASTLNLRLTGQWSTSGGTHNLTTGFGYAEAVA